MKTKQKKWEREYDLRREKFEEYLCAFHKLPGKKTQTEIDRMTFAQKRRYVANRGTADFYQRKMRLLKQYF